MSFGAFVITVHGIKSIFMSQEKKLSQQKLFSSVQIGWGKKRKSARVWQSLLARFQLKCCNVEKAYKFVTFFPERRKITL